MCLIQNLHIILQCIKLLIQLLLESVVLYVEMLILRAVSNVMMETLIILMDAQMLVYLREILHVRLQIMDLLFVVKQVVEMGI